VPRILYVNGCAAILESMASSGADVLSIDWRISMAEARTRLGSRTAIQGNMDPCVLLGPKEGIAAKARRILDEAGPIGHILNLGHGILPMTPVENARAFVEFAQSYRHSQ
jgi:uroporphyrinogen decarboxylase